MAEREGFEPSNEISPVTRLAGERLQPTRPSLRTKKAVSHEHHVAISRFFIASFKNFGFTPCESLLPAATGHGGGSRIRTYGPFRDNGFQDRLLKPLGHPSVVSDQIILAKIKLIVKKKRNSAIKGRRRARTHIQRPFP